jgi:hypothetical protein
MASSRKILEAERLLEELDSWTEDEVEELPMLYRRKAREYRSDMQQGEE